MYLDVRWKIPDDPELKRYLQLTPFCNFDHPDVKAVTSELICTCGTPKEAAVKIFYFVRDQIKWAGTHEDRKLASETLQSRRGACFNKATLQIAMLRVAGIPARYHFQIFGKEGFAKRLPPGFPARIFFNIYPDEVPTAFAEVYLNGCWLAAATTIDSALDPQVRDWDGDTDLPFLSGHQIIRDGGTSDKLDRKEYDEIEQGFASLSPEQKAVIYGIYHMYLDFLRYKTNIEVRMDELVSKLWDVSSK